MGRFGVKEWSEQFDAAHAEIARARGRLAGLGVAGNNEGTATVLIQIEQVFSEIARDESLERILDAHFEGAKNDLRSYLRAWVSGYKEAKPIADEWESLPDAEKWGAK